MSALHVHAQIALAPWRQRLNEHPWWPFVLITAMAFAPALGIALLHTPALGGLVAMGSVLVLLQGLWMLQFGGLQHQNHPVAARLVPGHLQRLREHLVATFLGLAALSGLLGGLAFGHGLAIALGAAGLMVLTALFMRWPLLWVTTAALPVPVAWMARSPGWQAVKAQGVALFEQQPMLVTALVALILPALTCLHLQNGDAGHLRSYVRGQRLRATMRAAMLGQSTTRHQGRLGQWLGYLFTAPFRAWMARLIAEARVTPRSVLARAELTFGASTHWTSHLGGALLFGAIIVLTWFIATVVYGVDVAVLRERGGVGMAIGAMSAAINPVLALRAALHGSRREQALLMLVPGMPRGAALNRALALRQARQFLFSWAGALLLIAPLTLGTSAFRPAIAFAFGCLPAGLLLWRDWARTPAPTANGQFWPAALVMVGGGLLAASVHWLRLPLWSVALAVPAVTVTIGWPRWRRLSALPQAMPVGRLA